MHSPAAPRTLRFGAFEADLHTRELRKQGMQIKLQDQPFQILAFFLEHPGEIVTREQLGKSFGLPTPLWTSTTVSMRPSIGCATP